MVCQCTTLVLLHMAMLIGIQRSSEKNIDSFLYFASHQTLRHQRCGQTHHRTEEPRAHSKGAENSPLPDPSTLR